MTAPPTQNFSNHRRFVPGYHFVALPILAINMFVALYLFIKHPAGMTFWAFLVAVAIAIGLTLVRGMILRVQNRIIRLELMMRLAHVLPPETRGRMSELQLGQMVGLRFASDAELPVLVQRCLNGELTGAEQVKKEIKDWQPDYVRA